IRAETFRQREMLYVDASKAIGFPDRTILLRHILPNSILAVLALLPFDIMAAVSREAALAFLGLGEEQSCSWGVLMDEGRAAFPADSSLLWPPAIVLTILLVAIASVGQSLQAALDPKTEE
ncbi:MAG: ABC transporter permease subunit, partial [Verrucomicrobia bacterium]|nr:ABC transporter permease subunit [Verrucomicrobiota bacterium]